MWSDTIFSFGILKITIVPKQVAGVFGIEMTNYVIITQF